MINVINLVEILEAVKNMNKYELKEIFSYIYIGHCKIIVSYAWSK